VRVAEEFQGHQTVEQLSLTMSALLSYRRLYPDFLDHSEQPITANYIADLDALLHGTSIGNSGKVAERLLFALARQLQSIGEDFGDIRQFLETVLDREPPQRHFFDALSDEYVRLRMSGRSHETTMIELTHGTSAELR